MGHLLCGRYYQPYHRIGTDDLHLLHEDARRQAAPGRGKRTDFDGEVQNPTFPEGQLWITPDATTDEEKAGIPYESLRWHVFKNLGADNMFKVVRQHVFEFIKHIGTGEESAYSRYMKSAIFLIPNARTLTKVIDGVDSLDMNNRDAMGDVYEYILGKMAASAPTDSSAPPDTLSV